MECVNLSEYDYDKVISSFIIYAETDGKYVTGDWHRIWRNVAGGRDFVHSVGMAANPSDPQTKMLYDRYLYDFKLNLKVGI